MFTDFFLKSSRLDASQVPIPDVTCNVENILSSITISMRDTEDLLSSLDVTKVPGLHTISHGMLRNPGEVIVASLARLFTLSISSGIYPTFWNQKNIVAIYMKNYNAIVDN